MTIVILLSVLCLFVSKCSFLMIKKECLHGEVHKSCSFYEEYTCWETQSLTKRVKSSPKRLAHCKAGCFCKKGMVRTYPNGGCILAQACRDLELKGVLQKIPAGFSNI
ncbi:uncharacterized protein LOC120631059 [Pararge aegeria]|uniref:uncharacterized protein LOC120631059 n=1 Tax=Pararge aegeria TaxID=116150 RepID=UPI0019D2D778|nr:uncharacterized protein LOC120631059 [Pararge aegeria]